MNQGNLKIWADGADKICFGRTYKILEWELIFDHAVKRFGAFVVRAQLHEAIFFDLLWSLLLVYSNLVYFHDPPQKIDQSN